MKLLFGSEMDPKSLRMKFLKPPGAAIFRVNMTMAAPGLDKIIGLPNKKKVCHSKCSLVTSAISLPGFYHGLIHTHNVCSFSCLSVCLKTNNCCQLLTAVRSSAAAARYAEWQSLARMYAAVACKMRAGKWSGRVAPLNSGSPLRKRLTALNAGLSLPCRNCWHKFLSD